MGGRDEYKGAFPHRTVESFFARGFFEIIFGALKSLGLSQMRGILFSTSIPFDGVICVAGVAVVVLEEAGAGITLIIYVQTTVK